MGPQAPMLPLPPPPADELEWSTPVFHHSRRPCQLSNHSREECLLCQCNVWQTIDHYSTDMVSCTFGVYPFFTVVGRKHAA